MRWVGFSLIWLALVLFTMSSLQNRSRARRDAVAESIPA